MDEEVIDQSVPEVESQPLPETETEEVQTDEGETQDIESEDEPTGESEDEDVEYEGKQYKLPKELKDALLRQSDYTRKTQEVAEARKALETQQAEFQQAVQLQQQNMQEYAQLMAVDGQLGQYANVNWQQWSENDPVAAQQAFFQFTQLKDFRANLANSLSAKEQQALAQQQAGLAKQREQASTALTSEIKDWSPDKAKATREYISSYNRMGISEKDIADLSNGLYGATPIVWAHKAMLYDQMIKKANKPAPKEPAKPVKAIQSKAPAQKPLSSIDNDEEWIRAREKQVRSR